MDNNLLLGVLWSWSGLALSTIDAVNYEVILWTISKMWEKKDGLLLRYQRRKETQFKISSAQCLASVDEKEVMMMKRILFFSVTWWDVAQQLKQFRSYWHDCRIFPPGFSSRTLREQSGSTGREDMAGYFWILTCSGGVGTNKHFPMFGLIMKGK